MEKGGVEPRDKKVANIAARWRILCRKQYYVTNCYDTVLAKPYHAGFMVESCRASFQSRRYLLA